MLPFAFCALGGQQAVAQVPQRKDAIPVVRVTRFAQQLLDHPYALFRRKHPLAFRLGVVGA